MGDLSITDKKEFEETMRQTEQSEKAEEHANDSEALEVVISGRQIVNFIGFGEVIFDFPSAGLAIEADIVATRFRTKHLRSGEFLTESQLKLIYRQPTTMTVDGKQITIGNGEWPEVFEQELETLPDHINESNANFLNYRADYQDHRDQIAAMDDGDKKTKLMVKKSKLESSALDYYIKWLKQKARQLELSAVRAKLFSDSIEELAFFERIKFLAPSCCKKMVGEEICPLWSSDEEMFEDTYNATRIITAFNMFMRGLDISFFGDVLDESTT